MVVIGIIVRITIIGTLCLITISPSCLVYLQTQPNAIHMHTSRWRRCPNLSASNAPRLFLSFYAKLVNRFSKRIKPRTSLLTLFGIPESDKRGPQLLMDRIDEKRTKPNITSQFHSSCLTGVHREVCSTKAKQRWWMVPFILSFNCSPLAGSGSLHFPRHNCWLLNWLVTWVFTFSEPRSLYYQMTPTTTTSGGGRLHNNIETNGWTRFCTNEWCTSGLFKTRLFLSCECVAYLLFP